MPCFMQGQTERQKVANWRREGEEKEMRSAGRGPPNDRLGHSDQAFRV